MTDEAKRALDEMMRENPKKIVVSNRRSKEADGPAAGESGPDDACEKIVLSLKLIGGILRYQAEKFTKTQVFHENMDKREVPDFVLSFLERGFRQVNAFSDGAEFSVRISKKGKVTAKRNSVKKRAESGISAKIPDNGPKYRGPRPEEGVQQHNRKKKRLIEEGTAVAPLIDMGIFTKEGKIVKSMGDKFRQINRFLEIVDDAVDSCGFREIRIVDFGCGKAYLTFILYYYLNYVKKIKAYMTGLDLKADVIRKCSEAALRYGYSDLKFQVGDISVYESDEPVDMVITLHACDTATDYALWHAADWNSRVILSVPCCQHEMNGQIEGGDLSVLTKYGLLKERFSALATDAVRASLLEYLGYKTQVLEFVDFSHTPKNVMIRAVKTNLPKSKREKSLREVEELMREFHVNPALYRLLMENGVIS